MQQRSERGDEFSSASSAPPREISSIREQLHLHLTGSICLLAIGNRLSGDDAAGPLLFDAVYDRMAADCFDGGMAPENFLEKVVRSAPDMLLIVDAVTMDAEPGEIRILDPGDAQSGGLSTHGLPLSMLCEYLQARHPMQIHLLAIQPEKVSLDSPVSPSVTVAISDLAAALIHLLPLQPADTSTTPIP